MKLHKMTCPNCDGMLEMKVSNDADYIFCPYCGQQFFVDEDKKTCTINQNININKHIKIDKTVHSRYTDDAEVIKAQSKDKENKRAWIALIVCAVIALGIPFGMLTKFDIEEKQAEKAGKICAGFYKDYEGEKYEAVVAQFEAMGFKHIDTIDLEDSGIAFWKNETVQTVSVAGNSSFDSTDYFYTTDPVIITYH